VFTEQIAFLRLLTFIKLNIITKYCQYENYICIFFKCHRNTILQFYRWNRKT